MLLKIENLAKSFGKNQVLKEINLTLKSGDIFALVGKNGAGKTTLIHLLTGLLNFDQGTITLNKEKNNFKSTCVFFQTPPLYLYLNCKDNINFLSANPEKAFDIFAQLNGSDLLLNKKTQKLSYGQKKKLGLAISLSKEASLYLLDEPTNGLDADTFGRLIKIIKKLASSGSAFILASHEWSLIKACCNRFGMLHDGTLKNLMDNSQKENRGLTVKLKTSESIAFQMLHRLHTVKEVNEIDSFTFKIGLQPTSTFRMLQQDILASQIPLQELSIVDPIQQWEEVYNEWGMKDDHLSIPQK